jgi:hypothetical protein
MHWCLYCGAMVLPTDMPSHMANRHYIWRIGTSAKTIRLLGRTAPLVPQQ